MDKDCKIYSTYMNGDRTATVVRHKTGNYWGVHLIEVPTSNAGFLMWHPTKSESWCENIAENFCEGIINQEGRPSHG